MAVLLKSYQPQDAQEIAALFYECVHAIAAQDYTQEQLDAWAPKKIDAEKWCAALQKSETVVAWIQNQIVGFANLQGNYFDRLFVHKDFQSQGIATKLAEHIEKIAVQAGEKEIFVAASHTAKPFFEKREYTVSKKQIVKKGNIELENFLMKKVLKK